MAAQDEVRIVFGYFERRGNALCYRYEAERVVIEPWGENSLRVRAWKTSEMDAQDWALLPQEDAPGVEITAAEDHGSIINGKIRAEINLRGEVISFTDRQTGREFAAGPMNRLLAYKDVAHGQKTSDVKRDNNYTTQVLYRLDFRWSPTSWDYVERMLTAIGGFGFFEE